MEQALSRACLLNDIPWVAQILRDTKDDPNFNINAIHERRTALHVACLQHDPVIVAMILFDPRTDPNVRDKIRGDTPLTLMCSRVSPRITEILLFHPSIDVNALDRDHRTPLYLALNHNKHKDTLYEILAHPNTNPFRFHWEEPWLQLTEKMALFQEQGAWELIREFMKNPKELQKQMYAKTRRGQRNAAAIFARIIGYEMGFLEARVKNSPQARFFDIMSRLPTEHRAAICNHIALGDINTLMIDEEFVAKEMDLCFLCC